MFHAMRVVAGIAAESIRTGQSMQRVYDEATTVSVGSWTDPFPRFDVSPAEIDRVLGETLEHYAKLSALGEVATQRDTQFPPQ